jgi:hypothetical protein
MIEVVPVGLTGGRIPLARKDTLGALGIVEGDMESTDSSEKIDELVNGLLGHDPPNQNLGQIGSNKWTPVHPGEPPPHQHHLGCDRTNLITAKGINKLQLIETKN